MAGRRHILAGDLIERCAAEQGELDALAVRSLEQLARLYRVDPPPPAALVRRAERAACDLVAISAGVGSLALELVQLGGPRHARRPR